MFLVRSVRAGIVIALLIGVHWCSYIVIAAEQTRARSSAATGSFRASQELPDLVFNMELNADDGATTPSFRAAQDEGFSSIPVSPNGRSFVDSGHFEDELAGGSIDAANEEDINTYSGLRLRFRSQ